MSLAAFLRMVVEILDESEVPHMLTGSLAAAYYAVPKATQDLDVVVEVDGARVERVVQCLSDAGCYVDRDAALEAQRMRGQCNAIDPTSGWKADLIVRRDRAYSRVEFDRRQRVMLLDVRVDVANLEDVVISKLEWSRLGDSELQRRDVLHLLERTWDQIDRAYVEEWVGESGLQSEWQNALARLPRAGGGEHG